MCTSSLPKLFCHVEPAWGKPELEAMSSKKEQTVARSACELEVMPKVLSLRHSVMPCTMTTFLLLLKDDCGSAIMDQGTCNT